MSNSFEGQAEEHAQQRDGVLDLIATVVLRCGGAPTGTIVGVMFAGEEDLVEEHGLQLQDVASFWGEAADGNDIVEQAEQRAQDFLPQMRRAVGISRAERVALLTFGLPEDVAQMLTGRVVMALQLPAQRVAVTAEGWSDLDHPDVFGSLDEIVASRAATSAVLAGLPFPAREFER